MPRNKDFEATYNEIRNQLKAGVGANDRTFTKEDIFWATIEGAAAVLDGAFDTAASGIVGGSLKLIYDAITGWKEEPAVPNPWFVWNGHDDNPIKYTRTYLKNRKRKNMGGSAISIASGGLSFVTAVDVGGIAMHTNALGSTGVHLLKFKAISKSYKQTQTIAGWIDTIMKMKAIKLGIRTVGLVGSSVPVPAVGIVAGLLGAAANLGAQITMTKLCLATSADLHWRAFQELAITSSKRFSGGTGPALRIVHELFQRRGVTRIFGQYNVEKIIREPIGWLAIQDKLMLI